MMKAYAGTRSKTSGAEAAQRLGGTVAGRTPNSPAPRQRQAQARARARADQSRNLLVRQGALNRI